MIQGIAAAHQNSQRQRGYVIGPEAAMEDERFDANMEAAWSNDWIDYYGRRVNVEEISKEMEDYRMSNKNSDSRNTDMPSIKQMFDEQVKNRPVQRYNRYRLPPIPETVSRRVQEDLKDNMTELVEQPLVDDSNAIRVRRPPPDLTIGTNPEILNRFNTGRKMTIDQIVSSFND